MGALFKSPLLLLAIGAWLLFRSPPGASFDPNATGTYTPPSPGGTTYNPDGSVVIHSTINNARAQAIAEQLYERFYSDLITSDSDILNLLKGLNEADFKMVYEAFGVRPSGLFGFGQDLNLIQWCIKDVSESGIKKLRMQFPTIF